MEIANSHDCPNQVSKEMVSRGECGTQHGAHTGKEEQISAMAMPTNQVKKETTTQPQTRGAGPAYCRLLPYSGVIPVKSVIVEKEMASVLNSVCRHTGVCTSES